MMSAFPIVMVTVPVTAVDQDQASEGVAGWVRSVVTAHGYRLTDDAATADVVVGTDPSTADPSARTQGLVLIGADWPAPVRDLLTALGITLDPAPVDGTVAATALGDQAPRGVDLLARVDPATLTATGTLAVHAPAFPLLSAAGAPVAAASQDGDRRLVVLAVRPGTGPSADELLFNAITFAAGRSSGARPASGSGSGFPWRSIRRGCGSSPRSPICRRCRSPTGRSRTPARTPAPGPRWAPSSTPSSSSRRAFRTTPTTSPPWSRTSPAGRTAVSRCPTSWTRWSPSTPSAHRVDGLRTSSSSRCTRRTAVPTAMWKPFWCR